MNARRAPTVSAILITRDEEDRLARALESVRWADEIVVVDSGSRDRTVEVARRYTDRVYVRDWPGFGLQKQRALELATGEWVFSLDADEAVTPELAASVRAAVADPRGKVGFEVERETCYLGHWFGRRGWARDRVLRLFRRDRGRFSPSPVHERVIVDGPVGRLSGVLLHWTYRDIAHHVEKMNRYTSVWAEAAWARGRRAGALAPFAHGALTFLRSYLWRGGFLDGRAGFVAAGLAGIYAFLKQAKLWEAGLVVERADEVTGDDGRAGGPCGAGEPGADRSGGVPGAAAG